MEYRTIRDWLARNTRLEAELLAGPAFTHLIQERMRQCGLNREDTYLERLRHSEVERERVVAGVAVPETWFFRYPASFELLADHLRTRRTSNARRLRMLSAACAAGQEACSMAITALHAGWPADRLVVDAVDISRQAIEQAVRGTYAARAARQEIPAWALTWLTDAGDALTVAPEVLATVNFVHDDIVHTDQIGGTHLYDAIFCRNVLIYLNAEARAALIARLDDWLQPGGLLFVGHAESPSLPDRLFVPVARAHAFALQRRPQPPTTEGEPTPKPTRSAPPPRPPRTFVKPLPVALPPPAPAPPRLPAPATPPRPDVSLGHARELADRGDLERARQVAETVLSANRSDVATLELLGSVNLGLGRVGEARDWFRKAIYLNPNHEEALLQLALISDQMGYPHQANRYRQRAARAHRNTLARDTANDEQ